MTRNIYETYNYTIPNQLAAEKYHYDRHTIIDDLVFEMRKWICLNASRVNVFSANGFSFKRVSYLYD